MRICFISEAHSVHTQRWTSSLAGKGLDVHLISSTKAVIKNVTIHTMLLYSKNLVIQLLLIWRARRLLKELKPDIIHLFGLFSLSSLGSMLLVSSSMPLVISVWGSDVISGSGDTFITRTIRRYLLSRGKYVLATSHYLREFAAQYIKNPQNAITLEWGTNIQTFFPEKAKVSQSGSIVLGFAKRIHTFAGPDLLLQAFAVAHAKCPVPLLLKIAGEGPMEKEVQESAMKLGLGDYIEWSGWLGENELPSFYRSLDIFIMPSRQESYGMAAVESLASGVPVIAFDIGGIGEIVVNGETGILVEKGNLEALSEAIVNFALNHDLRKKMGIAARQRAEKYFNWETTLNKTIALYQEVAAHGA